MFLLVERTVPLSLVHVLLVRRARDQTDVQADGHEYQQHKVDEERCGHVRGRFNVSVGVDECFGERVGDRVGEGVRVDAQGVHPCLPVLGFCCGQRAEF